MIIDPVVNLVVDGWRKYYEPEHTNGEKYEYVERTRLQTVVE